MLQEYKDQVEELTKSHELEVKDLRLKANTQLLKYKVNNI
jgi:hypothetical protein